MNELTLLSDDEHARYEWQMWIAGFGERGQLALKRSTVLISRLGGVGGTVAYYLAAAGVGRLIVAHAGNIKPSDLNRQLLMTTAGLGRPRVESAVRRLQELNPEVEVMEVPENLNMDNADRLAAEADLCIGAAPLFDERMALNAAAVRHGKPLIDCAMYDFQGHVATMIPNKSACLACICPEPPPVWTREFPVLGAVSGTVACMGAVEAVKLISGIGQTLAGQMLLCDLSTMQFRRIITQRRKDCPICREQ